jgi:hypothetical protein
VLIQVYFSRAREGDKHASPPPTLVANDRPARRGGSAPCREYVLLFESMVRTHIWWVVVGDGILMGGFY